MTNYELYIKTINTLASSQGCYGRMKRDFEAMSDADKKRLEIDLNDFRPMKDVTEMVMFLEGGMDESKITKYGKQILSQRRLEVNGDCYECYVLDDGNYYNIHIVDEHYRDEESNTLKLQEPQESITLEQVTSKAFMLSQIMEHVLWHLCYGEKGKHYDFNITYEESDLK